MSARNALYSITCIWKKLQDKKGYLCVLSTCTHETILCIRKWMRTSESTLAKQLYPNITWKMPLKTVVPFKLFYFLKIISSRYKVFSLYRYYNKTILLGHNLRINSTKSWTKVEILMTRARVTNCTAIVMTYFF